jgi:hypothetical protein
VRRLFPLDHCGSEDLAVKPSSAHPSHATAAPKSPWTKQHRTNDFSVVQRAIAAPNRRLAQQARPLARGLPIRSHGGRSPVRLSCPAPEGIVRLPMGDVVAEVQKQAEDESRKSRKAWHSNLVAHYVVGIIGVAAGATAAISAIAKSVPAITAAFAFAGALAAGLQSFLNAEAKARHHYVQASEWIALARRAELLAQRGSAIAEDDVLALIEAARVLGEATFGASVQKSGGGCPDRRGTSVTVLTG